jgi:hypothetical protein
LLDGSRIHEEKITTRNPDVYLCRRRINKRWKTLKEQITGKTKEK